MKKAAIILSHFDEYTEGESIANSFIKDIELKIFDLLKEKNPKITPSDYYIYKEDIKKCLKKLSKNIHGALNSLHEIELDQLKSKTIDIDILRSMSNEVDSIKDGDTVIVIYPSTHGLGATRYILEFDVFELDFLSEKGRLGISSWESPWGGMIDIAWCELVVKKESYLQLLQSKK